MINTETYMVEIVTKKNAKLIKRFHAGDKSIAMRFAEVYIDEHPQYDAHVHSTLGKGGYVREKVIKGKDESIPTMKYPPKYNEASEWKDYKDKLNNKKR
jgi:hypothetical protein